MSISLATKGFISPKKSGGGSNGATPQIVQVVKDLKTVMEVKTLKGQLKIKRMSGTIWKS